MKKILMVLIVLSLCAGALVANGTGEESDRVYILKVGLVQANGDPLVKGLEEMKKGVESRTNGKVLVEIYPSSQLGDTRDLQEQALTGANVGALTDAGRLAEMVPEIGVMGGPYIVDSYDEAQELSHTPSFEAWENELADEHGLRVLSFNWYQGARHLLTNKPIKAPEDLKGMVVRTPGSPVWQETIRAMGAEPTALAWSEIYSAIQQGVIDGAESHHSGTYGSSFYEVVKYIAKTAHFQLNTCLVVGEGWFNRLPEEYRTILLEEAEKGGDMASRTVIADLEKYEQMLKDKGMIVNTVDIEPFKQRTEAVYKMAGLTEAKAKVYAEMGKN